MTASEKTAAFLGRQAVLNGDIFPLDSANDAGLTLFNLAGNFTPEGKAFYEAFKDAEFEKFEMACRDR